MTRATLAILFLGILMAMLWITVVASMEQSIFEVGPELTSDSWFQATLADAYFGFLTFYVWVAYKETRLSGKLLWFVLIMLLGNIAISIYVLIQLRRWKPAQGFEHFLVRHKQSPPA